MIELQKYSEELQGNLIFSTVNLTLKKNTFNVFLGKSGIGKSTLIKRIASLTEPTSGNFYFENKLVNSIKLTDKIKYFKNFGIIRQDLRFIELKTIKENILFKGQLLGLSSRVLNDRLKEITLLLGISDILSNFPTEISGGELQRAIIASACIHHPKIIFADEPTSNLDPKNAKKVMELFQYFHNKKTLIIMGTHDIDALKKIDSQGIDFFTIKNKGIYDYELV